MLKPLACIRRSLLPSLALLNLMSPAHGLFLLGKFFEDSDSQYMGYQLGAMDFAKMKTKRLYESNTGTQEYTERDRYASPTFQGGFFFGAEKKTSHYEVEIMGFRTTLDKIKVNNFPTALLSPNTTVTTTAGSNTGTLSGTSGRLTVINLFFNYIYNTPQISDRYPTNAYIGLGFGPSFNQAQTSVAGLGSATGTGKDRVTKTNVELAGQFILGLAFQFDEENSLFLDYRYIATTPTNFVGAVGVASGTFNGVASAPIKANTIQLGVIHYFGGRGNVY